MQVTHMTGEQAKKTETGGAAHSTCAEIDPLLVLLERYESERRAFDNARPAGLSDEDWDRIARLTWAGTQARIIATEPRATTSAGALLALNHVLQSEDLFADRSDSPDLQMILLLIKSARDYIASSAQGRALKSDPHGPTYPFRC
jgi:hypothetical protein